MQNGNYKCPLQSEGISGWVLILLKCLQLKWDSDKVKFVTMCAVCPNNKIKIQIHRINYNTKIRIDFIVEKILIIVYFAVHRQWLRRIREARWRVRSQGQGQQSRTRSRYVSGVHS